MYSRPHITRLPITVFSSHCWQYMTHSIVSQCLHYMSVIQSNQGNQSNQGVYKVWVPCVIFEFWKCIELSWCDAVTFWGEIYSKLHHTHPMLMHHDDIVARLLIMVAIQHVRNMWGTCYINMNAWMHMCHVFMQLITSGNVLHISTHM